MRLARGDFDLWLHGEGIDVGCGDDPLVVESGSVRPWDIGDGDGAMLAGIADGSLDFLYSSHCLEHLEHVPTALLNWARVLRKGGRMYFVVPDYQLYEKLNWPSSFNTDHKNSFTEDRRLSRERVGRMNHWVIEDDIRPLLEGLRCQLVLCRTEDEGFDYSRGLEDQTHGKALSQILCVAVKR